MAIGVAGAHLTGWVTSSLTRGNSSAHGWFVFCSAAFAFVLCGATGGIVIELLARRRLDPRIPTARIVSRTRVVGSDPRRAVDSRA
jgi:hypothetical protein